MPGQVVVVGLGPGDPGLVSGAVIDAIAASPRRFLRTRRHPSAHLAEPAESFDPVYERCETIDEVYAAVVEELVAAASHGAVLYAVPGSPLVAERTVELLRADPRVEVHIVPSLSFVDLAWQRLGVDPIQVGARLVDGHRFAAEAAGDAGPFLVAQCDTESVLSAVKLSVDEGPDVTVLQRLGLDDETVTTIGWDDLDRSVVPDHLTSVWVPRLAEPVAREIVRFDELVRTLRERCPWDREQTHRSLTRHLVEEAYEVLEAIDELETDPAGYDHLEEELGDLLFQVAFHARIAAEEGRFTLADVARGIHDKLVRRHPHVFGPPGAPVPDWEQLKRAEKGRASAVSGVPANLPALLYAHSLQSKAAAAGLEDVKGPPDAPPGLGEALALVEGSDIGAALFELVNRARELGVDPEAALRDTAARFRDRVLAAEAERSTSL